jgi:hypothetical protein
MRRVRVSIAALTPLSDVCYPCIMPLPDHAPDTPLGEKQLQILEKQLERMRSMHYGYYAQFFQANHLFTVISLVIFGVSLLPPLRAAIFILPFFIVYAGFFCAYLLTYNLFARIYATALEKKINQILGGDFLVAHRMEDAYMYKTPGLKFVALDLTRPWTFIGASTVSFTFGGVVLYALAAYRAQQLLPMLAPHFPPVMLFWPLLIVWTLGHLAYLLWFYLGHGPEKQIAAIVNAAYGTDDW